VEEEGEEGIRGEEGGGDDGRGRREGGRGEGREGGREIEMTECLNIDPEGVHNCWAGRRR